MKLVDYHEVWVKKNILSRIKPKTGNTPDAIGLCLALRNTKYRGTLIRFFKPNKKEQRILSSEGLSTTYWASGVKVYKPEKRYTYTPLRQTIVLLICAMHDEL